MFFGPLSIVITSLGEERDNLSAFRLFGFVCFLFSWCLGRAAVCVLFCSCFFSVLLALQLPSLGKRQLILVLFVRLFDLRLFGSVLFVSSSSWCLGRAAVCNCELFFLPFL